MFSDLDKSAKLNMIQDLGNLDYFLMIRKNVAYKSENELFILSNFFLKYTKFNASKNFLFHYSNTYKY